MARALVARPVLLLMFFKVMSLLPGLMAWDSPKMRSRIESFWANRPKVTVPWFSSSVLSQPAASNM